MEVKIPGWTYFRGDLFRVSTAYPSRRNGEGRGEGARRLGRETDREE